MQIFKFKLLAIMMAFMVLPSFAQIFEYEGINYNRITSSSGSTCEVWSNPQISGDVVIPPIVYDGDIEFKVVKVSGVAFSGCNGLTSVSLPKGITSIEAGAFRDCSSLMSIILPEGLTDIGDNAFHSCTNLNSITLPEGVNSIGALAFCDCTNLTLITLPESLTALGDAVFQGCKSLTTLNIPAGITSIESSTFSGCSELTSLTLPEGLTAIGNNAFSGCSRLSSLYIPEGLITLGEGAFSSCSELTSLNIPERITDIGRATFSGCSSLTSLTLPEGLASIGNNAFGDCTELTSLNIPEHLTSIGSTAFKGCSSLMTIILPEGLKTIGGYAFWDCIGLKSITLPASLLEMDGYAFRDCDALVSIDYAASQPITTFDNVFSETAYQNAMLNMPNATIADIQAVTPWNKFNHAVVKDGSLGFALKAGDDFEYQGIIYTVIDAEAKTCKTKDGYWKDNFDNPSESTGVAGNIYEGDLIIPSTVSNGTTDYRVIAIGEFGFYGCIGMTTLTLPKEITDIGWRAFCSCTDLTSVTLPEGLTTIENQIFMGCSNLTTIIFPNKLTTIGDGTFEACGKLINITLPEGLIAIGDNAFSQCISLTTLLFPASLKTIGNNTFYNCSSITTLSLPEGLTSIGEWAFQNCSSLTTLTIPESLTAIADFMFWQCSGLNTLILPESLKDIGERAFFGCSGLTTLNLPASLQSIGERAFDGCGTLVSVNYTAVKPAEAGENVFDATVYENATLNMPNAVLADIQAITPWDMFKHIVAKDGSIGSSLKAGDEFEYQGIIYTVIDPEAKTCKTRDGLHYENPDSPGDYIDVAGNAYVGDLVIPSTVTDGTNDYNVIAIGNYGFYLNSDITSISLPEELISIGDYTFYGCSGLNALMIPERVTSIGKFAFGNCSSLNTIAIPERVTSIEDHTFQSCRNLTSIVLPEGIMSIGYQAFSYCSGLSSITLPAGLISIGNEAFSYCSGLTSIVLPEGVMSIGVNTFWNCSSLTSIVLPAGLTSIGEGAFWICSNLTSIDYGTSHPLEANENIFITTVYENATLNMPNAALADIQAITPWNMFKHVVAKDGSIGSSLSAGDEFEYQGIIYTVIDPESKTCKTRDGLQYAKPDSPGEFIEVAGNAYVGDLVIPSTVTDGTNDYTVVAIGNYGFYNSSDITSVSLPSGLTSIGWKAFSGCRSLTSINLPVGITSIEKEAFSFCNSLTSITLPERLTSIGNEAFSFCSSLTSINLPVGITSIGNEAFSYCNSLTSINLPVGITTIGVRTFYECNSLTSITLPERLTSIGYGAFNGCSGLTSINLPDGVKDIGEMTFYKCSSLTSITLPEGLTSIGNEAFSYCSSLTSITLPEGLTTTGEGTFSDCSNLTSINLPESLTNIGDGAFWGCRSLTSINLPERVKNIGKKAFYICGSLTSINLPEGLTSIGVEAFSYCSSLTSINLPNGVTTIGNSAFWECSSLTSINYGASKPEEADENLFSTTVYENATLNMPNAALADIHAVTPWNMFNHVVAKDGSFGFSLNDGDDFEYQGIIYTVIDAGAKTCKTKDGSSMENPDAPGEIIYISGNRHEGDLVIPATVTDGIDDYTVVAIGFMGFINNPGLTSVSVPESVSNIGRWAFYECGDLTSINLPEGLNTIDDCTFFYCSSLTTINLPSSLQRIGNNAFYECDGLTSMDLPGSVTNIDRSAFLNCSGLISINLPENVQNIGDDAFYGCDALVSIHYSAAQPIGAPDNVFDETTYNNATLNMPNAALADIQAVTPWNLFARMVAADGDFGFSLNAGDDFEYEGITYTVIDAGAKTCKTKDGFTDGGIGETNQYVPGNTFEGDLVIPDLVTDGVDEYTVKEIGNFGFSNQDKITSVILPETLETIGGAAFAGCSSMGAVSLPQSLSAIYWHAFSGCSGLTYVSIPESITKIWENTFSDCTNLNAVNLPSSLTSIDYAAFTNCRSLTSIDFPESLTTIENYVFSGCIGLTSIDLPAGVTSIGIFAFEQCSGLTSINLPDGLTSIGDHAFYRSSDITLIDYGASNPVEAEENTFDAVVYENATLNMPNATLADIQAVIPWNKFLHVVAKDGSLGFSLNDGDDFEYQGIIYTVVDPGAKTCKTKDGSSMENPDAPGEIIYIPGNRYEGDLVIPATVTDGIDDYTVVAIGSIGFINNPGLTSVSVPESVSNIGGWAFYECGDLTSINLPEGLNTIEDCTFFYCSSLTTINLPSSLQRISDNAFYECDGLTSMDLPGSVTNIDRSAFLNCSGLTSINLPESVQNIGDDAFYGCDALVSIHYSAAQPIGAPDNVFDETTYNNATLSMPNAALADIQAVTPWNKFLHAVAEDGSLGFSLNDGDDFEYDGIIYTVIDAEAKTCKTKDGRMYTDASGEFIYNPGNSYVGDLVIPTIVTDGIDNYTVVAIGSWGFCNNYDLISVILSEKLTSIGYCAFSSCSSLTSITLPEGLMSIEGGAFYSCSSLTSINLTAGLISIGDSTFSGCSSLTSIDLPESLKTIGDQAFNSCSSLTSINLPNGLTSIGYWTFFDCSSLTSLTMPESLQSIGDRAFQDCSSLTSINLPKSLESIDYGAFMGCTGLTVLNLPDRIISIGDIAFGDCSRLTSIMLPESLASIGDNAFWNCDALISVNYAAMQPIAASENVFSNAVYQSATLSMPNAALTDIQATTPWNLFGHIVAKDGDFGFSLEAGEDFEYQGIVYTVVDTEAKTCRTKDGVDGTAGNVVAADLVIPATVTDGIDNYSVTGIGQYGFTGCGYLTSATLPASIEEIGIDAFAECPRLTSLVWNAGRRLSPEVTDAIANPNLLVYVVNAQYAPEGMTDNVVVMNTESGTAECQKLALTTGHAFGAVLPFESLYSTMTKEFTQTTPLGGCAGWETIALPFNATSVSAGYRNLTPFALINNIHDQYPYWLYQAESTGEWKEAFGIMAGVPYIIAMPNNEEYENRYCISGPVTFSNSGRTTITPATTAPYNVTWASGHEFRPLWLPLDAEEASKAMGLNVGIGNLTNDEGMPLLPGSAFHVDVEPRPLEAYVTRNGSRRALPVMGGNAHVAMIECDNSLTVRIENGVVYIKSPKDRRIDIFRVDGACFGSYDLEADELLKVEGLIKGVYIIGGKKVMIL